MLADAGGEDQAIQPTQCADQGAGLNGDAIGEQFDRFARMRIVALRANADVATDAGYA